MRRWLGLLFVLLGTIFLAACGQNQVDTAVQYLQALDQGEIEDLSAYVCAEREDEITAAMMTVSESEQENVAFENVSCAARDEGVLCRFTIRQETESADVTQTRQVVFNFEDGRICGFTEQVAN